MEKQEILVVDDEKDILTIIEKALGMSGYIVTTTTKPAEVMDLLRKTKYNILISDLRMPELDGEKLVACVKKEFPKIEVIIMTAYATLETAVDCLKQGVADYLLKPFGLDELLVTVDKVCETERLKSELVSLKEMDKLKDGFIMSISHELNTPLAVIEGGIQTLIEALYKSGEKEENVKKSVMLVDKQVKRISQIIRDLIDYTKYQAKTFVLKKENVILQDLINDAAKDAQIIAKNKGISISVTVENNLKLNCDIILIRKVLANLLSNSIVFSHESGEILVSGCKENSCIKIMICDRGIGIEKDDLERIFERFYRVDQSFARTTGGFGLGLSICKEIVDLHNGKIWAESDGIGKGARFIFTLPL
jgi:signal transduction histidine kinase